MERDQLIFQKKAMKKVKHQIMEIRPRVVFEIQNSPVFNDDADPTTSLGSKTFTGLLTLLTTIGQNQPAVDKH